VNAATLKSPRLKRVFDYLRGRGLSGATTWEIQQACMVVAASTCVSEINANLNKAKSGILIKCKQDGVTVDGAKVYRYRVMPTNSQEIFWS
jgi:hypothetical protein